MERLNYPSLKALYEESGELMKLLEYESWGTGKDREEEMIEQENQLEAQQRGS